MARMFVEFFDVDMFKCALEWKYRDGCDGTSRGSCKTLLAQYHLLCPLYLSTYSALKSIIPKLGHISQLLKKTRSLELSLCKTDSRDVIAYRICTLNVFHR